ncbi:hypothetical protein EW146_g2048 [Bondarzewia mesenterica]|uniref:EthD domain-containing protein n=1 Tax=Bondarzewia mesenterica TaxID=1095465 RepID=A0A4S4M463_9AGAM|nr:hypothetical protein EW146_g2048 [Bondarzewia mesenterica]
MSNPKAFLLVFSEPGSAVTESEFHDWYNNEHVPLRVNTPTFSSWARYEQQDGEKPSWGALYDLESYEATQVPPYSRLAETRSEREKNLMSRLEFLDRRIYTTYEGHPIHPPSAFYDPKKTAPIVLIVGISVKPEAEEDFNNWYDEEHIPLLAKAPGWIRSRRFVLEDAHSIGTGGGRKEGPPKYLAVHEWTEEINPESEEFKAALNTPWRTKILQSITDFERRMFKLYKRWDREQ